jgi:hypothetical protein
LSTTGDQAAFRPLGIGEILDRAFSIYRTHFRTLCLCVLVVVVPMAIISTLITASLTDNAFNPDARTASEDGAAVTAVLASIVVQTILTLLAVAACTRAVGAAYLGHRVTWQESLAFALRRLVPLIVLSILASIFTMLGLIALLIGAIYVAVRLSLGSPALLIEDIGPMESLRRSWGLVGGRWWATFAVIVLVSLLVVIISSIVQGVLVAPLLGGADSELIGGTLSTLGTIVANVLTLPLQAAVVTILYFDLRVRKEGLDLERLSSRVGADASPAAVSHASGLGGEQAGGGYGGFAPPTRPGGFSAPQSGDPLRRDDEPRDS